MVEMTRFGETRVHFEGVGEGSGAEMGEDFLEHGGDFSHSCLFV